MARLFKLESPPCEPRRALRGSALWRVEGWPLMLFRYSGSDWAFSVTRQSSNVTEAQRNLLDRLSEQRFPTRRVALEALEGCLSLADSL